MTSKNLLKETLDNIRLYCAHANYDEYLNPKVFDELETLQKLIDQPEQLTFEQCVEEWEKKGYKVVVEEVTIVIGNEVSDVFIIINKHSLLCDISNFSGLTYASIPFEVQCLLTKTLKAWKELEDEYE